MRTKSFSIVVEERDEERGGGELLAYASTFDREPDSAGDVVARGAFAETLDEWKASGAFIPLLFGHRMDDPMMNLGRVVEAEEDERGLLVRAEFDDENENAQYVRKLVREGRLSKMSFAYDVLEEAPVMLPDGRKANELRKLRLHEVSLVPVPANQHADVLDVKSGESASPEADTLEKDEAADIDSAETQVALVADSASSVKAEPVEDDRTPDEGVADAPDGERLAAVLAALAERLDQIGDAIDALGVRAEAIAADLASRASDRDVAADEDIEAKADEAVVEADDADNREADEVGNLEVSEKAAETLNAMARYIKID